MSIQHGKIAHGTILGGLSIVPDMAAGIAAYRDVLGLELVEHGRLDPALAQSWNATASADRPYAVFRPTSGAPCWIRLVEQPETPGFVPTRTYGWGAFEFTVEDVWCWPDSLPDHLFRIVGPPKVLENIEPVFIPMQALGPGREMIYLNQVLGNLPASDLPKAQSPVDRIFIVILGAPDMEQAIAWYRDRLGLDRGEEFVLPYAMINTAFGLPDDHQTAITMVRAGRMPIVEVDDFPAAATTRDRHDGMLPPGNALVTLAVDSLDRCDVEWLTDPAVRHGALYEGRRGATTIGPAGELLECVETG